MLLPDAKPPVGTELAALTHATPHGAEEFAKANIRRTPDGSQELINVLD